MGDGERWGGVEWGGGNCKLVTIVDPSLIPRLVIGLAI